MDLLTLVRRQQEAENIFELFLGLYQSIAESGFSEAVRRVFSYDSSGQPRTQLAHHGFAAGFIGGEFHVAGGGFQSDGMPGVNTKTAVHEVISLGR